MARQISLNLTRDGGTGRNEPLRVVATVLLVALWVLELTLHRTLVQHALGLVLIAVLVRITVTDLEERRIKNRVTVPAALLAILIGLALHPAGVPGQVVAAVATGAFLFVFALLSRGGLGMGDVKLGFVLGLYLGPWVFVAMVVGLVASAVLSLGVLLARGLSAGRRTAIPLGPFLALGGVVALVAGSHWHLAT